MTRNVIPPKSRAAIELIANKIAMNYQPDSLLGDNPFNVELFAELDLEDDFKVRFDISDGLPFGVLGLTDPINGVLSVPKQSAEDESIAGRRRYRSTLAHEIGHSLLHVRPIQRAGLSQIFSQQKGPTLYRADANIEPFRDPEWQAWEFAGSILMPKRALLKSIDEGASVNDLAQIFDVNAAFVTSRLGKLRLRTKN